MKEGASVFDFEIEVLYRLTGLGGAVPRNLTDFSNIFSLTPVKYLWYTCNYRKTVREGLESMRKQTTRNLRRAAVIGLAGLMLFVTGCGKKKVEETTIAETTKAPETLPPPTTAAETEPETEADPEGMVRSYLTGQWVPEEIGTRRPAAVMISNVKVAQPLTDSVRRTWFMRRRERPVPSGL